jgi:transcriptional regulator with XRE-family HTH domain
VLNSIVADMTTLREDCGLSRRSVAAAAGLSASTVADIEAGRCAPSIEVLARIGTVLGADLTVRFHPGAGPMVRDHLQAAMVQAHVRRLDRRWRKGLEVAVYRPVRGVIDLVLEDPRDAIVAAVEAQSELRRIEQQVRCFRSKADALALARSSPSSTVDVARVLLLRSTAATRAIAAQYGDLLATAYPAGHVDLVHSLAGDAAWPGSGIVWCDVDGREARILDRPPRGVRLGR